MMKEKINKGIIVLFIQTVIIIALTAAVVILALRKPEVEEYIAADSSRIYDFYTGAEFVELDDYTYGKIQIPALTSVPRNTYDLNKLVQNGKYFQYKEAEVVTSKTGIDVSYHQREIDWEKVAADGIDFVMIRVGYRGYETGNVTIDSSFEQYINGASAAGLDVGVYFYSQALNADEAKEEADAVIKAVSGYKLTYPVVFDWEISGEKTARTADVSVNDVTDAAVTFCDTVAEAGYIPMIYSVKKCALMKMDLTRLAGYHFWFAEYKDEPTYPYDFQMWQYASDGYVDGVNGEVDLNISFVDYAKLKQPSNNT